MIGAPVVIGNAELYLGDCLEVLPQLPDESVDVVVADPPYNSGLHYGESTNDKRVDYWQWLRKRISLSLDARCVLVKHSALKVAEFQQHFPSRILVWVKPFSSGFPLNGVATHWEPIHWLKGKSVQWSKDYFQCSAGNANAEESTGHPAQMPVAVATWLLTTFCTQHSIALDPFMGSGTTGVACMKMGRKFIGIEIEPKYFDIACKRIEEAQKQQRLL